MGSLFKEFIVNAIIAYLEKSRPRVIVSDNICETDCHNCGTMYYHSVQDYPRDTLSWVPCHNGWCPSYYCDECVPMFPHNRCSEEGCSAMYCKKCIVKYKCDHEKMICFESFRPSLVSHYATRHPESCVCRVLELGDDDAICPEHDCDFRIHIH